MDLVSCECNGREWKMKIWYAPRIFGLPIGNKKEATLVSDGLSWKFHPSLEQAPTYIAHFLSQQRSVFLLKSSWNPNSRKGFPVGTTVVVRSNEDSPLLVGEVLISDTYPDKTDKPVPTVKDLKTGKQYICLGLVRVHTPELVSALEKLDWVDQWNILSENYKIKRT